LGFGLVECDAQMLDDRVVRGVGLAVELDDEAFACRDGRILSDLKSGKPRIETATLRERPGHENSAQRMRAPAALKAPQNAGD
jgi:hypothetical protein